MNILLIPLSFFRSFLFALLYLPILMTASLIAIFCNVVFNKRSIDDWIIQSWGKGSCALFGVKVHVRGLENIPDRGCLFLFNHTSLFDVFAIQGYVKTGLRFGAKIELFKIPFFGTIMRRAGILPIDRGNRSAVLKVYEAARLKIAEGNCYALAPEGTRNTTSTLAPFKSGPFILAIEAQAPIVPVVVRGASQILPKGAFLPNAKRWTCTIELEVLRSVEARDYKIEQRHELQEVVRSKMMEKIQDTP